MKKYIIGGIIGCLIALAALGIANYYTCFAYFLPHKPALIEIAPGDTLVTVRPEWIAIPAGANKTFTVEIDDNK